MNKPRPKPEKLMTYKARGIVQDNVHPNDRSRDMSQCVGTFKIEDGKVVVR